MRSGEPFGYLLVHFVEDPDDHAEQIYFSLSDGDDPLAWTRLRGGRPVLRSPLGTTGVRDPYLVRGADEFFIIATDLRIYGGDEAGWDAWTRHGSRAIVVWRSTDLTTWSDPWSLEIAPPTAGMAWAPEALWDERRGQFLVFWSSAIFAADDQDHVGDAYSRILAAWTPDFRDIGAPRVLVDRGESVIDTTMLVHDGLVHRISKQESFSAGSDRVFHEIGDGIFSDSFTTVARCIGADPYGKVEAPLIFKDHREDVWYLFVDRYGDGPHGYVGLSTTDLSSGRWDLIAPERFRMPAGTKHGSVLPLVGDEWRRIRAAYSA